MKNMKKKLEHDIVLRHLAERFETGILRTVHLRQMLEIFLRVHAQIAIPIMDRGVSQLRRVGPT